MNSKVNSGKLVIVMAALGVIVVSRMFWFAGNSSTLVKMKPSFQPRRYPIKTATIADEMRAFEQTKGDNQTSSSHRIGPQKSTAVILSNEKAEADISPPKNGEWKCCVNPFDVNDLGSHPTAKEAKASNKSSYECPENPSNFSWYYAPVATDRTKSRRKPYKAFKRPLWRKKSLLFVGGSTTRQMFEQLRWEMPRAAQRSEHNYAARFLFRHIEVGGCCNYDRSHILDLRSLQSDLIEQIKAGPDFVIFNVGLWWDTMTIGSVIDEKGRSWSIDGTPKNSEWQIANETLAGKTNTTQKTNFPSPPNLSFAGLMGRAIGMMKKIAPPQTKLVWRSEGTTDCPPGQSFRKSIARVLQTTSVPCLNISQATCDYLHTRQDYDWQRWGPHLCFPSVALRHWLLEFQDQFLI